MNEGQEGRDIPGSSILIELVITTKIAVRPKKGAAPTVVPLRRVVMFTSVLLFGGDLVAICRFVISLVREGGREEKKKKNVPVRTQD